jgi:UDP-glucuronate 4-epimerase
LEGQSVKVLVTGAAGFIGSHVTQALIDKGCDATAVDSLTNYYDVSEKRRNIHEVLENEGSRLVQADVADPWTLERAQEVDVVMHLAAQPGVRASWSTGFNDYVRQNITVTQALLEACSHASRPPLLIVASSSSVYGDLPRYPARETDRLVPVSPYGVTKAAAENLCWAYATNSQLRVVALRLFTVYGPRQRPDMAFRRLIDSALTGRPFTVYGDGLQVRDFTFVEDVVRAWIAVAETPSLASGVYNVAGGAQATLLDAARYVAEFVGRKPNLEFRGEQAGDVRRTAGDSSQFADACMWKPEVSIGDGLARQVAWQQGLQ